LFGKSVILTIDKEGDGLDGTAAPAASKFILKIAVYN